MSLIRTRLLVATVLVVAACSPSPTEMAGEAEMGETGAEPYQAHCAACHGGEEGNTSGGAPPHNAEGHTWHHGDCELIRWTIEGKMGISGQQTMPAFGDQLTRQEVESILAHVKTWWTPEQREAQARVTEGLCEG